MKTTYLYNWNVCRVCIDRILKKKMNKGQTQRTWRIKTLIQTIFCLLKGVPQKKKALHGVLFLVSLRSQGDCYLARRAMFWQRNCEAVRRMHGEDTLPWKHKDRQSLPVAFSLVEMTKKAGQCCNKERYCAHPYPQDSIRIDQGVVFLKC